MKIREDPIMGKETDINDDIYSRVDKDNKANKKIVKQFAANLTDATNKISELEDNIETLKKESLDTIKELQNQQKAVIKAAKDEIREEQKKEQVQTTELVTIFVSFFTFVSIEISIFKYTFTPFALLGLSLLNLGSILLFVLTINYVLYKNTDTVKKYPLLLLLSLVLLILGILSFGYDQFNTKNPLYIFVDRENDKDRYKIMNEFKITEFKSEVMSDIATNSEETKKMKECLLNKNIYTVYDLRNCVK